MPYRKRRHTDTQGERQVRTEAELERGSDKPRKGRDSRQHPKLGRGKEGSYPESQREHSLAVVLSPRGVYYVMAALGNLIDMAPHSRLCISSRTRVSKEQGD